MIDIDFLPQRYREAKVHRKTQAWRGLAAALFVSMLGSAAVYQLRLQRQADSDLEAVEGMYDTAQAQRAKLTDLQAKLQKANLRANLLTYLRHPWPATQVLSAVVSDLPSSVTLSDLKFSREVPPKTSGLAEPTAPPQPKLDEAEAAKIDANQRDLAKLREEFDKLQLNIVLVGITTDPAALHEFLAQLAATEFFSKAEVTSIESLPNDEPGSAKFAARLIVTPGYGQPGGPTHIPSAITQQTSTQPIALKQP